MIFEFAGLPRAGKTSIIDAIKDYYVRKNRDVLLETEGARSSPFSHKHRMQTAFWVANNAVNAVIEESLTQDEGRILLQDRGLFDAMAFIRLLEIEDVISSEDSQPIITIQNTDNYLLFLSSWAKFVDIVFWFDVAPSVAVERDLANRMSAGPGLITNLLTLKELQKAYDQIAAQFGSSFPKITKIDSSIEDSLQVALRIRDEIDALLEHR